MSHPISTLRLWDGDAPRARGAGNADIPTLAVYPANPPTAHPAGILVAPGGAYRELAIEHEGHQVASWFSARGITAFVLSYRVGERYPYPTALEDAERAMRWIRFHAATYRVSPDRIGMIGFSAGGHLAAMTSTVGGPGDANSADPIDRLESRPDFTVLAYPWLNAMQADVPSFLESYPTLTGLPEEAKRDMALRYTPVLHVDASTPPTFIYFTADDPIVPVHSAVEYFSALNASSVPSALHIFAHGPHGSGLGADFHDLGQWPLLLEAWLRQAGILPSLFRAGQGSAPA